ncbi:hypothetical protein GLYMA_01G162151v4 [Glycine max]|nr:hypothetical protein GLYMA_01G162151v4 [Glycine max]KAH1163406.1 hypothetical protein GYH30_001771 [Glycine max]
MILFFLSFGLLRSLYCSVLMQEYNALETWSKLSILILVIEDCENV